MLFKKTLPLGAVLLLAGCASLPADRGLSEVRGMVKDRGGLGIADPAAETRTEVSTLLAEPLTAERAVAVALLRSPTLRREYAQLGLAQSDVLEASRLSNPTLSVSVLSSNVAGDRNQVGYGLVQNFTDLLFLSAKGRIARGDLARVKQEVAGRILELTSDVRQAYYRAASAGQVAQMREVVAHAAETSGELAKRFHDAGNINELEWKREQAAGTQARLDADAAKAEAAAASLELNALLGLRASEMTWSLDAALPLPVADETPVEELQKLALERRLDLAAKRAEVAQVADVRSLAGRLGWLGVVEVGIEGERETDGTRLLGPTFSLQLPIFNQGQASIARIDAMSDLVQAELAGLEAEVGISVATAYQTMLAARARADRHLRDLIPQREAIVARTQELQNFMIVGPFELLVAKQEEYDAYQSYLEAIRDYWVARAELGKAVGSRLPSDERIPGAKASAVRLPAKAPAMNMGGHEGHSMQDMPQGMDHESMGHESMDHGSMDHGSMDHGAPAPSEPEEGAAHGHDHHAPSRPEVPADAPAQPVIQEEPHAPHN